MTGATASTPQLSIVVPARNEEVTVAEVVASHANLGDRLAGTIEILVIDDGSTDETYAKVAVLAASDPRIRLWRHEVNRGIEPTLLELYAASRGLWVYFAPADGQVPPAALEILWSARHGHACVVGRRQPRADPLSRKLLAAMYSFVIRSLFGVPVKDIDSTKLFDGERLRRLRLRSTSTFAEAEILIRLARAGASLLEMPIPHEPRRAGRAHGASLVVIIRTVLDLIRSVPLLRAPRDS